MSNVLLFTNFTISVSRIELEKFSFVNSKVNNI